MPAAVEATGSWKQLFKALEAAAMAKETKRAPDRVSRVSSRPGEPPPAAAASSSPPPAMPSLRLPPTSLSPGCFLPSHMTKGKYKSPSTLSTARAADTKFASILRASTTPMKLRPPPMFLAVRAAATCHPLSPMCCKKLARERR
eukprot:763916-Hanusia_phi.AAC.8